MHNALMTASIFTALLALVFVGIAGERAFASSQTSDALHTIHCGLDWDNVTPISPKQQTERLAANVEILKTQKSSRNFWGGLGISMSMLAASALGMLRERKEQFESTNESEADQ